MEVLIASNHEVIKEGFMKIIAEEFPSAIINEVSSDIEAEKIAHYKKLDLIIIELNIPNRGALDVLKRLRSKVIKTPVLIFSLNPENLTAIRILKAGGNGYVSTDNSKTLLIQAIRTILNGKKYITPEIAEKLACNFGDYNISEHECITDRELQILKLIGSANSVSEIAKKLSLSISTISTYRARILEKMGLKNNAEIMNYAIESHLV